MAPLLDAAFAAGLQRGFWQQGKVNMFLRYSFACLLALGSAGLASADTWADSMFDELSRDFGSVPRGPVLQHPFRFVNNTGRTVRVVGVRVSCGCVSARALQQTLAPGQETAILANMDTSRFLGHKSVTIFVTLDQPQWAEVRLWVQANSRDDVSVNPDTLAFGRIKRGVAPTEQVKISFFGNNGWQITGVQSDSNYILPAVKVVQQNGGELTYQLTARVRGDAPVGKWYTDVWVKTNNPASPKLRVPLTVEIESALRVSPATVYFGQVKAGQEVERKVIVSGTKAFRITKVTGTDGALQVKESNADSKAVHVLTVQVRADKAGELNRTVRVLTDLPDNGDIEFHAWAQVTK
jgi:Protein of unknown function (DUF1573)